MNDDTDIYEAHDLMVDWGDEPAHKLHFPNCHAPHDWPEELDDVNVEERE